MDLFFENKQYESLFLILNEMICRILKTFLSEIDFYLILQIE